MFLIELVKKSNLPNNVYIENNIYGNDLNSTYGFAKFYIKDNIEYIYQENNNKEKTETYINNENNTSITILHPEKSITQNINNNIFFEVPSKKALLEQLNNSLQYNYIYCGKKQLNELDCIKISIINTAENSIFNYYIDENSGYIIKYEFCNSNKDIEKIETYEYKINAVTEEHLNNFNLENYSDYTFYDN